MPFGVAHIAGCALGNSSPLDYSAALLLFLGYASDYPLAMKRTRSRLAPSLGSALRTVLTVSCEKRCSQLDLAWRPMRTAVRISRFRPQSGFNALLQPFQQR